MRSYSAESAWLAPNASAPAPACRKLTIDKRNATPTKIVLDSKNPSGDEAEGGPFILLLEYREQHHRGADAGEGHDDLQDTADDGGSVRAGAEDVVRALHRAVDGEGWHRDKREQVEYARGQGGLSRRAHRGSSLPIGCREFESFSYIQSFLFP